MRQSGVSLCYRTHQRVGALLFRPHVSMCYVNHDTCAWVCVSGSKSAVSSTIVTQPSTRSIKPISTLLLYQSASLLSRCNEEEFYREFLFAGLKNFVPTLVHPSWKIVPLFFRRKFNRHLRRLLFLRTFELGSLFPSFFFFFFFFVEREILQIGINRTLIRDTLMRFFDGVHQRW